MLGACVGPEAPDAAVCADYIQRLCTEPICREVPARIGFSGDCASALLSATRCADPAFTFSAPSRERFLQCRAPLLRAGNEVGVRPSCEDVSHSLTQCPDMVTFLRGERR